MRNDPMFKRFINNGEKPEYIDEVDITNDMNYQILISVPSLPALGLERFLRYVMSF